jgi:hypothetical protein
MVEGEEHPIKVVSSFSGVSKHPEVLPRDFS